MKLSRVTLARVSIAAIVSLAFAASSFSHASAAAKTKFWNVTGDEIVKFELAPAGTTKWGPDQCKNDKDDSVDDDERLEIKDVAAGSYDARITFKNASVCLAKSVNVEPGKIFSIEKNQLVDCTAPK